MSDLDNAISRVVTELKLLGEYGPFENDVWVVVDAARRVANAPTRQAFQRRVEHVEDGESSLSIPAWITEIGHDHPFIIIELGERVEREE